MCDERERLIGYVYGEGDSAERRTIADHLEQCPECRTEIAGLERTRQDLLAWDVPRHDPIWRPVAPVARQPFWREVPGWAMAAAAGLVLSSGVTGGVAARWLVPVAPALATTTAATAVSAPLQSAKPQPDASPTAVDLAGLEQRLLERARVETRQQIRQELAALEAASTSRTTDVATQPVLAMSSREAALNALTRRVAALEGWANEQVGFNFALNNRVGSIGSRAHQLDMRVDNLQRVAFTTGFGVDGQ
jgi:anti-sigma factor RsiW